MPPVRMPIPEVHRQLLRDAASHTHYPEDVASILKQYHAKENSRWGNTGVRVIDALFHGVAELVKLLESGRPLPPEKGAIALAAVRYFLVEGDLVEDSSGSLAGLVDDALVVAAAREELAAYLTPGS